MEKSIEFLAQQLADYSSIVVLSLIVVEWGFLFITNHIESNKESLVSVVSYLVESIPYILLSRIMIVGTMFWLYEHRFFTFGFQWYVWVIAYLLYDFIVFFVHFLGHKVRLLWCIHGVHHTAEEMNLSVVARGSIFDFFLTPQNFIWLPIMGFHPLMLFIIEPIGRLYATYTHLSEKFVGKHYLLEKIFVTPSVHRVHHAKNHIYLDRNFGETFCIWDRFFKTFQTQLNDEEILYGIMHDKLNSKNIWQVQFQLWKDLWFDVKNAPKVSDKIKYILKPPGWNHIDGGKRSEYFRSEAWTNRDNKSTYIVKNNT